MSNITITKTNGGLGRRLPTQDHISGIIFYNNYIPSGWLIDVLSWVTGTAYVVGDKVYDPTSKNYYIANTAHTASASFSTDVAKWTDYKKTALSFKTIEEIEAKGILKGSTDHTYEWYQLSEYFRINPDGEIYVYIAKVPVSSYSYNEVLEIQDQAFGVLRQIAVFAKDAIFASAEVDKIQLHANTLEGLYTPAQIVFNAKYSSLTISTLPDMATLSTAASNVSVNLLGDGNAYGSTLAYNGNIGAVLGAMSKAKVNESIAWVEKFNLASTELDKPSITELSLVEDLTESQKDTLNEKHYIFGLKRTGTTGTYLNDSWTSDSIVSDYNDIQLNRTYHKAFRGIRTNLLPLLNSPLRLNKNGTLSAGTVTAFKNATSITLFDMMNNGELSAYSVNIDPSQNVLADSTVRIDVRIVPYGTAREIRVTLGYTASL